MYHSDIATSQKEYEIQWIINEQNPSSSQITIDGIADAVRSWDGSIITLDLHMNELGIGTHTVSITVTNTERYSSTDVVYIIIVEGHDTNPSSGLLPFTSLWVIIVDMVAISTFKRRSIS